jgi:hypothetical protein
VLDPPEVTIASCASYGGESEVAFLARQEPERSVLLPRLANGLKQPTKHSQGVVSWSGL